MNDYFDGMEDDFDNDDYEDAPTNQGATCLINGSRQTLEEGADFMGTVRELAVQAGFGKFRVYVNGEEVRKSTCPSNIEASHSLEIRPYDEAG